MPEKILSRISLPRYLPIWRVAPARHHLSLVTVDRPLRAFC
jgi:hypothetical protein